MPVGIEITDDAGNQVINPDLRNFGLINTGQVICATLAEPGADLYIADIVVTGRTNPLLAIHGEGWAGLIGVAVSGASWTWRIAAAKGQKVDYWVFDQFGAPAETFGLEVFDAAGARIYHSGAGGLRVLGFVPAYSGKLSYTPGRKIAVVQSRPGRVSLVVQDANPLDPPNADRRTTAVHGAVFPASHEVTVGYTPYKTEFGTGFDEFADPAPEILVVDVTDLGPFGQPAPAPDITPTGATWGDVSAATNTAATNTATIGGINQPITLEVVTSNPGIVITPVVAGSGTAPAFSVTDGQTVRIDIANFQATPQSGTLSVINRTDGDAVLDTIAVALAANLNDVTPNAVNWTDINNTATPSADTNSQTISGLDAGISVDISATSSNGNMSVSVKKNGSLTALPVTVSNGDALVWSVNNGNPFTDSTTVTVRNVTDGNTILDTFAATLGTFGGGGF